MENKKSLAFQVFYGFAEELYPDCFDYSEVDYVDEKTEVTIICNKCGNKFKITPNDFLNQGGCCYREDDTEIKGEIYIETPKIEKNPEKTYKKIPKLTTELFIQRCEEKYGMGTYGYDQVVYVNSYTKVKIYCPICNEYFEIRPSSFLDLKCPGCPKCSHRKMGQKYRMSQDEWISKAQAKWGDICDYSGTVYTGANNDVEVYCKEHQGYFRQRASTHMTAAYGCPICSFKHTASESLGEKEIEEILTSLGISYEREYQLRGEIQGRNSMILRIDFKYIIDGKEFWIEYHGEQHYTDIRFFGHGDKDWFKKQQERDQRVREYCRDSGISLLEIPYTYIGSREELVKIILDFNQGVTPEVKIPQPGKTR